MAQMAVTLSRLVIKRMKFNYMPLTTLSSENYISNDKDLSTIDSGKTDSLLLNLKASYNAKDVFTVISKHSHTMNQKHIMQALRSLFLINKHNIGEITYMGNPNFEQLCGGLKKFSRVLELNEIIEAVKVLSYLKVPVNSSIYQILLQLVRQNINNLNLQQIIFLQFVFHKSENNHLVDALRLALPLAFQLHLRTEIEPDNVPHLVELLKYCSRNNIPTNYTSNIITCLILNEKDIKSHTLAIISSLSEIGIPKENRNSIQLKLLQICLNILSQNMNDLTYGDMMRLLKLLKYKIENHEYSWYHEDFMDACGNYIIEKNLDFYKGISVARILSRIAHTHLPLLDYLTELLILEPETLSNARPVVIFSYITALSNANYKPPFWDQIQKQIFKNEIFNTEKTELPWTKFAIELASLDIFHDDILNKIFDESFLTEYLSRDNNFLDYLQLLQLHQAVSVFNPTYSGNVPSKIILQNAIARNMNRQPDDTFKTALEHALGGPQYFASGVEMPDGSYVDFLVALDNGDLIKLPNQNAIKTIKYDDLLISNSTDKVCILPLHKGSFSINSRRLRGHFQLFIRTLEHQGFIVIPIDLFQWLKMPQAEKIPYIMREINYKYPVNISI